MNKPPCEQYSEWMSLAQDGMLSSTQTHLLHTHVANCKPCRATWETMTTLSQMLRAAPLLGPVPGFVERFEARLAYRQEQHRRVMIWFLLGIGAVTLALLALPSILSALSLTGYLVLPYEVFTYLQGLVNWFLIALETLADAAWVLIRHVCRTPALPACLALVVAAGLLLVVWTRFLFGRLVAQRVDK